ncbi:cathepsin W-like [Leptodactylus fuscus]|uniref:cathepsin W-like n=1 Tax=Leptodactylus fuscus TaxID=238119 RepID=UPI003F4E8CB1
MFLIFGLFILSAIFTEAESSNFEMVQFTKFVKQFKKNYKSLQEYEYRLSVFTSNMKEAERLQKEELGTAQYGMTKFSDLTAEEFRNNILDSNFVMKLPKIKQETAVATKFPQNKDWRKHGVISEVKNQGVCGSCWAFAAVGNIEAQWGILGCPKNLSVQQVIDCGPCDAGCIGGFTWQAFITVQMQGGLASEKNYKYIGVRKQCRKDLTPVAWIHDFQMLPKNETAMTSYVGTNGTLTVIINNNILQHYKKGIIHILRKSCDPDYVNHAVLIVGYVQEKKIPYWILKNSYGTDWGEKGYFKIFHGRNICGITKYPLTAIVNSEISKTHCPPGGTI